MAKKRIYPNVISARLTEPEKEKLEAVIQQLQSNKSEFLRDVINSFINNLTIKV
jgi:predicted DNA-binding protein